MSKKTLSVVVLNFNESAYIRTCLEDMCGQSFRPKEIIVVDNCSTDDSPEIVKEMSGKYPFIQFVKNDINRGFTYSVNRGAKIATGDYIYIASANDIVYPGFFEKSMEMLEKYPQAGLSCTDFNLLNVADGSLKRSTWISESGYYSPDELVKKARISQTTFSAGPNSIIRADVIPEIMYVPEIYCFGDWFLSKLIAFRYGCVYIPEPLAAVRWINNSLTDTLLKDRKNYQEYCSKVIQLYASPEYEDIAPAIIKSRSLRNIDLSMRNPLSVLKAIYSLDKRNKYANILAFCLVGEYFCTPCEPLIRKCAKVWQSVYDLGKRGFYLIKNIFDQAYAKAFANYQKAKTVLRK